MNSAQTATPVFRRRFFDWRREWKAALALAALVAVFYGSSLGNGFVYDDNQQLVGNMYVHSLRYIPDAFTSCIWKALAGTCQGSSYYRPMHNLAYIATSEFSDSAAAFHFANLLYFYVAVLGVYALGAVLTGESAAGFFAAALFLAHPAGTEVVDWVASVPELLMAVFVPLTIMAHIRYRLSGDVRHAHAAWVCYGLAILSKEPAALTPVILVALDYLYFGRGWRALFARESRRDYWPYVWLLAGYFVLRNMAIGGFGLAVGMVGHLGKMTAAERVHTMVTLFAQYLQLLAWPHALMLFHPFVKSGSLTDVAFLASLGAAALYVALTVTAYVKRWRLAALTLTWIPTFLLPVLVFSDKVGENVFTERYAFMPTMGLALLVGFGLARLWRRGYAGRAVAVAVTVAALGLALAVVWPRNAVWRSDASLYADTLAHNPAAAVIAYNQANLLLAGDKPDLAAAKAAFTTVLARYPAWTDRYKADNNLGEIERQLGNDDAALAWYKASIADSHGTSPDPYRNLAAYYVTKKKILPALATLCLATRLDSSADLRQRYDGLRQSVSDAAHAHAQYVHDDLLQGGAFTKAEKPDVTMSSGGCDASGCYLVFTPDKGATTPLLPELIMGDEAPLDTTVVPLRNVRFDPKTGDVVVDLDLLAKRPHMTFYFPRCGGTYSAVGVTLHG